MSAMERAALRAGQQPTLSSYQQMSYMRFPRRHALDEKFEPSPELSTPFPNKSIVVFGGGLFAWNGGVFARQTEFKQRPVLAWLISQTGCKSFFSVTLGRLKRWPPGGFRIPLHYNPTATLGQCWRNR